MFTSIRCVTSLQRGLQVELWDLQVLNMRFTSSGWCLQGQDEIYNFEIKFTSQREEQGFTMQRLCLQVQDEFYRSRIEVH